MAEEHDNTQRSIGVSQSVSDEITSLARHAIVTTELAVLASRHLPISQCAGGKQVVAGGPCDHCGSTDPANDCHFVQIGTPLITG